MPTAARRIEGGRARRALAGFRLYASGLPFEYRSHRTLLGLPLVHVINGLRLPGQPACVARAWLAVSPDIAKGVFACGAQAYGLVTVGAFSFGALFSFGGFAVGLLSSFGGLSGALIAFGGVAGGYLALGGCSVGYGAVGGLAVGRYAMGGHAYGAHVRSERRHDITKQEFFEAVLGGEAPWMRLLDEKE